MILVIDNYDSFVHNLARYIRELGRETVVVRNDAVTVDEVSDIRPTHIVISPGPCTPTEAGVSMGVIEAFAGRIPLLGVCLGHQCVAAVLGGRVVRSGRATHGKASLIRHDGSALFAGIPSPFRAGRYHSLSVDAETLPEDLEVTAVTADEHAEIMALRHRSLPVWGVQFHPESVLTRHGHALLRNFLEMPTCSAGSVASQVALAGEGSGEVKEPPAATGASGSGG